MVCKHCGKEFKPKRKAQKYCCAECAHKGKYEEHIKTCPICGKEFHKTHNTYCSLECAGIATRKRQTQKCVVCGKEFLAASWRQSKYCSMDCRNADWYNAHADVIAKSAENKAKRDADKERRKIAKKLIRVLKKEIKKKEKVAQPPVLIECKECGTAFEAHKGAKYCSDKCRRKHSNRVKEHRIYRNGKPDLSISLTKLYMRDMGVCALCGMRIDFDGDSNGAHYPSIDHIIPLSKGGTHSWDNVQLACRDCNSAKGNRT